MLQDQASVNEGIESRCRSQVDAANDEHDREVEDQGSDGYLLLLVDFTEPAAAEDSVIPCERPSQPRRCLVGRIESKEGCEQEKEQENGRSNI